jgi:bifunctional non-homologous end joining protein LigD
MDNLTSIEGKEIKLTNLDKVFWPQGLTKAHLIKYYVDIAPTLLPYLKNRPMVLVRYPDGIYGDYFYQKNCPDYAPDWVVTTPIISKEKEEAINYVLCNDLATLIWMANQGNIEIHPWMSKIGTLEYPEAAIFDLDPSDGVSFNDVLEIAQIINSILTEFKLQSYPKTSGATGIHIHIPILNKYSYTDVKDFLHYVAKLVLKVYPHKTTLERVIKNRTGKVYIDYLQNGLGKTIAGQYSLRPFEGAPVSTPLTWEEIQNKGFEPKDFNIFNIFSRLKAKGDIFQGVLDNKQNIDHVLMVARK